MTSAEIRHAIARGVHAGIGVAVVVSVMVAALIIAPVGVLRPATQSVWWLVARHVTIFTIGGAGLGAILGLMLAGGKGGAERLYGALITGAVLAPIAALLNVRFLPAIFSPMSLVANAGLGAFGLIIAWGLSRVCRGRLPGALTEPVPLHVIIMAALALALPGVLAPAPPLEPIAPLRMESEPGSPATVVLVTVDTLRADHLGCYGYARATSPEIDAIAAAGIRFDQVFAQAPNTHPSLASMLTGHELIQFDQLASRDFLPPGMATLATRYRELGYHTAAVVSNPYLKAEMGFGQGFERFEDNAAMVASADRITDLALGLAAESSKPLFLWVHYLDPHHPYWPPEPWRYQFSKPLPRIDGIQWDPDLSEALVEAAREGSWSESEWSRLIDLYDGEIAYTDSAIGRLFKGLAGLRGERDFRFVLTADHGEEFRDHGGVLHSHSLHDELIRIPLVMWPRPIGAPPVTTDRLSAISVGAILMGRAPEEDPAILSEKLHEERSRNPPLVGLRSAGRTLVVPSFRPFQRWSDPRRIIASMKALALFAIDAPLGRGGYQDESTRSDPSARDELSRQLRERYRFRAIHYGSDHQPGEETLDTMRGLGYLE